MGILDSILIILNRAESLGYPAFLILNPLLIGILVLSGILRLSCISEVESHGNVITTLVESGTLQWNL